MRRFWKSAPKTVAVRPAEEAATHYIASSPSDEDRFVLSLPGGKKQEFTLNKTNIVIGRATANDIVLADPSVSRRHARIERVGEGFEVVDLGSANGVTVNGTKVARCTLKSGDVFGIGDSSFRIIRGQERSPEMTSVRPEQDFETTLAETPLSMNLEETAMPRVIVLTAERTWEVRMKGDNLTIGGGDDNAVVIRSDSVSRRHAVIERKGGSFLLRDRRSTNGTWIRNQRVSEQTIEDGQAIRVGTVQLFFKGGFATDELTNDSQRGTRDGRRPVVFVPGFAGSTLWSGSEKIWPTRAALLHPDAMRRENPLVARGPVDEVAIVPNLVKQDRYSSLINFLKGKLALSKRQRFTGIWLRLSTRQPRVGPAIGGVDRSLERLRSHHDGTCQWA